jgi:hypothetical protein
MAISIYLQIITALILGIFAAVVPPRPIMFSGPCGVLPASNNTDFNGL